MRVLIACEFSGIVREAFAARGHDAWSCDLLPTEIPSSKHLQCDVFNILHDCWDLVIAHPPCTYLCNSGVRWLHTEPGRWEKMREAAKFFRMLLENSGGRVAVENPIPHKYAIKEIGVKYSQLLQPYQFGHGETKATCLWLRGLPRLKSTAEVEGRDNRIHRITPGVNRWKERSRTYEGIARAMAEQWGGNILVNSNGLIQ